DNGQARWLPAPVERPARRALPADQHGPLFPQGRARMAIGSPHGRDHPRDRQTAGDSLMAARKAKPEPEAKTERPSKAFRALIAQFREKHPDKWDEIALVATQHGVDIIAEHLERL